MNKAENTHAVCISEILLGLFLSGFNNFFPLKYWRERNTKSRKYQLSLKYTKKYHSF